jgi:hypothetical protein
MESTQELENLKIQIEKMSKNYQLEILKILNSNADVKLNENKSGVFVNLSFLPKEVIPKIKDYINYVQDQEKELNTIELKKQGYVKNFFDETTDYSNVDNHVNTINQMN